MPYKDTWGEQAKERSKKRNRYFREYRKGKDKLKTAARMKLFVAIRSGKIKPQACSFFGEDCKGRTEGHHFDYNYPLSVVWLCTFHHRREHNILKAIELGHKFCLMCRVKIYPPKYKYCSDRCNLKHWKLKQMV